MPDQTPAKVYVILGSHACRAGLLMLDHKGVAYRKVTLPTGGQRMLRLRGWPHGTVPALVIDGQRVQTNIAIARALDERIPERPLLPADPELREQVEQAEAFADDPFQMMARRTVLAAGALHGPDAVFNRGNDGRLGPLLWKSERARNRGVKLLSRFVFNVNADNEPHLLAELAPALDRIDGWVDAGVLNGPQLNAADFALAPSLALLTYRLDLRDDLAARPLGALIDRVLPEVSSTDSRSRRVPVGRGA